MPPTPLPERLARALPGLFLAFDGPDGSGKSTQLQRFADACAEARVPLARVRDPGGTPAGDKIRELLLGSETAPASPVCETLLFMASRAELVDQKVRPALARGELVLSDRFLSSTFAYQGAAGGVAPADIEAVAAIACGRTRPDLTVVFDVSRDTAARRLHGGKPPPADQAALFADAMETRGRDFDDRVRDGFLRLAEADPARHAVIDASADPDAVFTRLLATLDERVAALPARPEGSAP